MVKNENIVAMGRVKGVWKVKGVWRGIVFLTGKTTRCQGRPCKNEGLRWENDGGRTTAGDWRLMEEQNVAEMRTREGLKPYIPSEGPIHTASTQARRGDGSPACHPHLPELIGE